MTNCEMIQYWDQLSAWIDSQRLTNPSPTTPGTDWTVFPYTTFDVIQHLNPNIEHEGLSDTTVHDGVVYVILVDSDEETIRDRGMTARKDISLVISFQRHCEPNDLAKQKQCINTIQALKDCCRRFRYSNNGQPKKSYMGSEPEKDQVGQTIPWLGMRTANIFHALFTVRFANALAPVDDE